MGNSVEHVLTQHDRYDVCNNMTEDWSQGIYHDNTSKVTNTGDDFKVEIVLTLSFLSGLMMLKKPRSSVYVP